jgi:hypothetical protein
MGVGVSVSCVCVVLLPSVSEMVEKGIETSGDDDDEEEEEEEGAGRVGRSSLVTSMGASTGVALVDSREIGRGTIEFGRSGQVSNAVERD